MTPELVNIVKCCNLQYLGHIMKNQGRYKLLQCILQKKLKVKEHQDEEEFPGLPTSAPSLEKHSTVPYSYPQNYHAHNDRQRSKRTVTLRRRYGDTARKNLS